MHGLISLFTVVLLFLTVASLLVIGGALVALLLFFPLFLLAVIGVLSGLEDSTVRQRNPSMDPTRWRNGS